MSQTMESDTPTINLPDAESGRSILCYVQHSLEIDDKEYLLLMPVDAPVQIFAWESEDEDEEEETLVDLADEEIDTIFDTARAVLAEQDLTLKRTAFTLTVSGELPEIDEDDLLTLELGEGEEDIEEYQPLTHFFHQEKEYDVYTPVEPLLFFVRMDEAGQPVLLSPEEFQAVRPQLEERLFDVMDD